MLVKSEKTDNNYMNSQLQGATGIFELSLAFYKPAGVNCIELESKAAMSD